MCPILDLINIYPLPSNTIDYLWGQKICHNLKRCTWNGRLTCNTGVTYQFGGGSYYRSLCVCVFSLCPNKFGQRWVIILNHNSYLISCTWKIVGFGQEELDVLVLGFSFSSSYFGFLSAVGRFSTRSSIRFFQNRIK